MVISELLFIFIAFEFLKNPPKGTIADLVRWAGWLTRAWLLIFLIDTYCFEVNFFGNYISYLNLISSFYLN